MTSAPVVVVGAGPAGCTAALLLATRGIRSVVFERRTEPLFHPAAHVINARTFEIWREYSPELAARIAELSPPRETINLISWYGSLADPPVGSIDLLSDPEQLAQVERHSPYMVSHVGQHLLMPVLWEALENEPLVDFRRGAVVSSVVSDESGATVTVDESVAVAEYVVRADYVLACDGANSPVRDGAEIELDGPVLANMGSAFFRSDSLFPDDARPLLSWVYTPELCGVLIAHADHRYILMTAYLHPSQQIASESRAYWQRTLGTVLGTDDFDLESTGTWVMTSQTATSFRSGRLLLLGDAAHRFPHTGGFGLNSGVQDAHNIAWKLDAVLRGAADEALLNTYETERRPVVERFAEQSVANHFRLDTVTRHVGVTNKMLHTATEAIRKRPMSALPGRVLAPALDYATRVQTRRTAALAPDNRKSRALRQRMAVEIPDQLEHFVSIGMQFGYVYDGPLVITEHTEGWEEDVVAYHPTTRPGARMPHVELRVDNRVVGSHDVLDPTTLTIYTCAADDWRTAMSGRVLPPGVSIVALEPADEADRDAVVDLFEVGRTGAVVVRPDGHVFWRTSRTAEKAALHLSNLIDTAWGAYFRGQVDSWHRQSN